MNGKRTQDILRLTLQNRQCSLHFLQGRASSPRIPPMYPLVMSSTKGANGGNFRSCGMVDIFRQWDWVSPLKMLFTGECQLLLWPGLKAGQIKLFFLTIKKAMASLILSEGVWFISLQVEKKFCLFFIHLPIQLLVCVFIHPTFTEHSLNAMFYANLKSLIPEALSWATAYNARTKEDWLHWGGDTLLTFPRQRRVHVGWESRNSTCELP